MNGQGAGGAAPVAVVIVNWNSGAFLPACLDSLRGQTHPPQQTIIVDNASSDGSKERVAGDYPEIDWVDGGCNLGFCKANNLGIRRTTTPFVLVLNPDTRLEADFLEQLLPAFDDPDVGLAAGKLLRFDGRTLDSAGQELGRSRQPKDRGYGKLDRGQFDHDGEVFGVCGAAALYRRAMLESIADPGDTYFDEAFFAFVEDLDLAWRARRLGWRAAYRHCAVGYHARGATAERGSSRGPSMLRRRPEIRFHIAKNRYLTILRNDTPGAYLRNLPFIWSRDLGTLALLLLSGPRWWLRLLAARPLFRRALERRRLDSDRPRHQSYPPRSAGHATR